MDGARYSDVFDDIKERHPDYKIAIFYVYCDEETVYARTPLTFPGLPASSCDYYTPLVPRML